MTEVFWTSVDTPLQRRFEEGMTNTLTETTSTAPLPLRVQVQLGWIGPSSGPLMPAAAHCGSRPPRSLLVGARCNCSDSGGSNTGAAAEAGGLSVSFAASLSPMLPPPLPLPLLPPLPSPPPLPLPLPLLPQVEVLPVIAAASPLCSNSSAGAPSLCSSCRLACQWRTQERWQRRRYRSHVMARTIAAAPN